MIELLNVTGGDGTERHQVIRLPRRKPPAPSNTPALITDDEINIDHRDTATNANTTSGCEDGRPSSADCRAAAAAEAATALLIGASTGAKQQRRQAAAAAALHQLQDVSPRNIYSDQQQQEQQQKYTEAKEGTPAKAHAAIFSTSEIEPYQEPQGLAPSGPQEASNRSVAASFSAVTDPSSTHGSASSPFSSSLALAAHSAFSRRSNISINDFNSRNARQHRYYQQQQLDQAAATKPPSRPPRPQQAAAAATGGRNNDNNFITSSVLIPRRGAAAAKAATFNPHADDNDSSDSNQQRHSNKRGKQLLLNSPPNKQHLLPVSVASGAARPRTRLLLPSLSPAISYLAATAQKLSSTAFRSLIPQRTPTTKLYRPLLTAAPSPGGGRQAARSSHTVISTCMLPLSSTAGVRGGGGASLRQYHSPLTKFVWTAFASNMVLAVVFGALCATSYKGFNSAVDQIEYGQTQGFPAGAIGAKDWQQLFLGAAISAAFAVGLTIVFHVLVLALLCCSLKSLADPGRRYGRAFALAAALFVGLHILNIALQFRSYSPTLSTWRRERQLSAPTASLLDATVVLGLLSFVNYMLLAGLLFMWQDPQDVYLLDRGSASPAGAHT